MLRVGRPVLAVVGDMPQIQFTDGERGLAVAPSGISRSAGALTEPSAASTWLAFRSSRGTGWLVGKNTIVTNRHVALEFGRQVRGRFGFKKGSGAKPITASINFLEEVGRPERLEFQIVEILHIEDEDGPDFALLRVEVVSGGGDLPAPITLATSPARSAQQVAVIGYPARDRRVPDDQLMQSIFGDVYDKKRLAPGQVTESRPEVAARLLDPRWELGSALVDLATRGCRAAFAGRFLEANYAVPAAVVAARLEQLRRPATGDPRSAAPPRLTPTVVTR